jgi:glycosyltransferase involved in cell wall biosynthesis
MEASMAVMIPVSVVVPVRNEEKNLPQCLERLARFAEVIVVDSASTDASADIARRFGAKLLQFLWNGQYPKKRNWVLTTHKLLAEWVLFLDADELVDDRFCDAVAAAVAAGQHQGFWLHYRNYFLGRELRHGVPQRKLALFRVDSGLYERVDERRWSNLDMEVHEHPIVKGSIGTIHEAIEHRDLQGIGKFVERHCEYAAWEARRFLALENQSGDRCSVFTKRQRFKYARLDRWWFPWAYFIYAYALRRGFLDGGAGFYYAVYKVWYYCTVRLLIKEWRGAPERERGSCSDPCAA